MAAEVLTSALLGRAGFVHGFATRRGGASPPPFDALNFHATGDETAERVADNLRLFAAVVGFSPDELHLVHQVHGAAVHLAPSGAPPAVRPQADAVVLDEGRIGGVRVADCVPILVADLGTGRAAAIHAGWRGVEAGVIGAALHALGESRGGRVAAIGPCIGPCCFEVGADVAERIAAAAGSPAVVVSRRGDKAHVDLRLAVQAQLTAAGMKADEVELVGGCTKCDPVRYFSYRRDGERSGRHLAVIRARPTPA